MSRPKPEVLLEALNKSTYKAEQVLVADAIYSVFYLGKPINLRIIHTLVNYPDLNTRRSVLAILVMHSI